MLTDAHCHPSDLRIRLPEAEAERRALGVACAASAWNQEQFEYHEQVAAQARADGAPPIILCFAVHPQLPATEPYAEKLLSLHCSLLTLFKNRLDAVGETGFDLYDAGFRATEALQDELFAAHVSLALEQGLPLVLHIRRAMHKVFAHTRALKRLPAVIFHSWSGTLGEGEALLRRGIKAYFSFGAPLLLNHKEAIRSWAQFPANRLLLETDAPYQPLRGAPFSRWGDLPVLLQGAACLRKGNSGGKAEELEALIEGNFYQAYGLRN
jgi:TatD DNase family protein